MLESKDYQILGATVQAHRAVPGPVKLAGPSLQPT